ncbi:MAG: DUF120 domain-containing protein [Desulfurococcales archaeon]|jgi:riboflavin kinase
MLYEEAKKVIFAVLVLGGNKRARVVQSKISEALGVSQQTVSRLLNELEAEGYIVRTVKGRGEFVELTENGLKLAEELYGILSALMRVEDNVLLLEGKVVSGLGEGRFYMNVQYYKNKIKELLGFLPYPGTLNVQVIGESALKRMALTKERGIRIEGFKTEDRFYGGATLFRAKVNGYEQAAIIIPDRTSHPREVLEVIAPIYLRGELGLSDGDRVLLEVKLEVEGRR